MTLIHLRGTLAGFAAVLLCASPIAAQDSARRSLNGTVALGDDPVADVPVTLHRVTPDASGAIGSQVTGAGGEFEFRLPPSDTADFEVFFVTAEYLSVRYFGEPVHAGDAPKQYSVAVYDTASVLPGAVRVARRDIVLIPETQGGWEANEIIRLRNTADRTLVSRQGMPVWEMRLPEGVTDFQAGEGELTAAEIARMGDRVLLVSSLLPGNRELFLRYRVAEGLERAILPIDTPTDTLHVFVGQPSPAVEVGGLESTQVVEVQGERFVQYGTTGLEPGDDVSLTWDAPAAAPLAPELAGSIAALLVLFIGSYVALRSRVPHSAAAAPIASQGR